MTTRRNPQFNVRIPPELKEKVVALAEKNKRPVNAEINAALESWVDSAEKIENQYKDDNIFIHHQSNWKTNIIHSDDLSNRYNPGIFKVKNCCKSMNKDKSKINKKEFTAEEIESMKAILTAYVQAGIDELLSCNKQDK